jgi:hypothetical protein
MREIIQSDSHLEDIFISSAMFCGAATLQTTTRRGKWSHHMSADDPQDADASVVTERFGRLLDLAKRTHVRVLKLEHSS